MRDTPPLPATSSFFARRWRAEVPLAVLFWRDLLAVGTLVNLFASFGALVMVAQGVAGHWAVAVHLAPLPYNLFLAGGGLAFPSTQQTCCAGGCGVARGGDPAVNAPMR